MDQWMDGTCPLLIGNKDIYKVSSNLHISRGCIKESFSQSKLLNSQIQIKTIRKLIQCGGNTSTNIYSTERKTCFINNSQIQIKTIRKLYKNEGKVKYMYLHVIGNLWVKKKPKNFIRLPFLPKYAYVKK